MSDNFLENPFELSNLEFVDAGKVEGFIGYINSLSIDKKLVIAIGTGGTISMKIEDGVKVPDINSKEIMEASGRHINNSFDVESLDIFLIDSSQMNYLHIAEMAIVLSYIYSKIKQDDFIGFIICHGTDTMSYSSATLSLMLGQGLPFSVIFTGAQKPLQEPMNDAINNIKHALYTLESLHSNNMAEILIVMGKMAILGTSSEKVDDERIDAFDAPIHKYVTRYNKLSYPVKISSWVDKKRDEKFTPSIWKDPYGHSLVIKSTLGLSPEMVAHQLNDDKIKSVILYSYGASTVHKDLIDRIILESRKRNISIFVINPTNTEPKTTYLSTKEMIDQGVIPLHMTLPASLAKFEIAWRKFSNNRKSIAEFMTTNYVGEIPNDKSRYIEKR